MVLRTRDVSGNSPLKFYTRRSQGTFAKAVRMEWWGRQVLVAAEEGMGGEDPEKDQGQAVAR